MTRQYVAGLFDGEGSIGIYKTKGSKDPRYKSGFKTASWVRFVSVTNTYKPVLEMLKEQYGGRIHQIRKADGHYKNCYQWILGSKIAISDFLNDIYQELYEKRRQAVIMINECTGWTETEDAARELKELK